MTNREYKPGETVPASGIYRVTHDSQHVPHEVTVIQGRQFPPCRSCRNARFVLVKEAIHINDHPQF